jgi:hypothetical protein
VDNLVTLCLDQIDCDRLALRQKIVESLARLEKETLISRSGDIYFFLTNEERDINKEIKSVDLLDGEESKVLGEIIFEDVIKGPPKHRYSANKKNFDLNRRCDQHPIGNQKDGGLLVSVVTPLADDYETYGPQKCVLTTSPQGPEGGFALILLGNDEILGRELRTYKKTLKYLSHKDDGTLPESTKRILRDCAEDNLQRRIRLAHLLGEMLVNADYFVAGQPLKIKATAPCAALDEAMEYLIQNTFSKMSYLKRLSDEPLKEVQAVLRSNDTAKEALLFQSGENNPEALEEVRTHVDLCSRNNRPVVLHDMIEKRYALRPYGWPDEEVLLLVARLLVLGEISLMMDGTLIPLEQVYNAISKPANRRKVVLVKRHTSDPKAIQNARSLGKELFAEMGPDGEDALFAFLQGKFKDWQANLNGWKHLADTGDYPGKDEIAGGLALVNKLLSEKDSFKFIERFNTGKSDLTDFAEDFHSLDNFYGQQKPTWEKLRKAHEKFQRNRLELERDNRAGPALNRMQEILAAPNPYGNIKEAEGLIATVSGVNSALLADCRRQAIEKIDAHYAALTKDMAAVNGDPALRTACLKPLERLRQHVEKEESIAHITQAESEAVKEFDAGIAKIEEFTRKQAEKPGGNGPGPVPPVVKIQHIVRPAELVKATHLETKADVDAFLDALRQELEKALANNERIQIR